MGESHLRAAKAIQQAWTNKDYAILEDTLAEHPKWYERPYGEPLTTRKAVVNQWKQDLSQQEDVNVTVHMLTLQNEKGTYEFEASFKDSVSNDQMNLVGTFYVELDSQGEIALFKQWWMLKNT